MSNVNDARILKMKEQIAVKKEELAKIPARFLPKTNCVLDFNGSRRNIQTFTEEELIGTMIQLHSLIKSAEELDILDGYFMSGYHVTDWMEDIKAKLSILKRKGEEQKLKAMEAKLTQMLSEDKKIELELNEFENLLK
jgi:hypothetical protein